MADFNTHGGYFAPKDYLRINEGGSHEENPNGGVQIGVDPEGNPNLLEEGEPVYKDYVYSDNITADREFLEKNNLPVKYAGKLYSKIADSFCEEAEDRPLDPISNNGLEVMLARLADAQEEQKQRQQQMELEEELANMSPEELDELEAMLAQGEEEQMQPVMEQPIEMPMMKCGGTLLKKYDGGGSLDEDEIARRIAEAKQRRLEIEVPETAPRNTIWRLGARRLTNFLDFAGERKAYEKDKRALDRMIEDYASGKDYGGTYNPEAAIKHQAKVVADREKKIQERNDKEHALFLEREEKTKRLNALRFPFAQSFVPVDDEEDSVVIAEPKDTLMVQPPVDTIAVSPVVAPADSVVVAPKTITEDSWDAGDLVNPFVFKNGGQVNRFDDGGWERLLNALRNYKASLNPGGIAGTYAIDRRFPLGTDFRNIKELEDSEAYRKFTDYILANSEREDVLNYLRLLDERTAPGITKLFDNGVLRNDWKDLYNRRRYDQKGGIYHISGNIDNLGARPLEAVSAEPATSVQNPQIAVTAPAGFVPPIVNSRLTGLRSGLMYDWMRDNPTGAAYRPEPEEEPTLYPGYEMTLNGLKATGDSTPAPSTADTTIGENRYPYSYSPLPTISRYAGAIGSGLLGLYDAFVPADRYTYQRLVPQTPESRINLQNEVYNPVDQNMVANSILAQGNATTRALRNSGLGPSTAAAILASDNNTSANLGTGFLQTWDANNQRRNQVIAANNQSEVQRANHDWAVDSARKQIINDAAYRNAYNDLMVQRLNYAAEGDKYQAIGNQISNGLQALSNIGKENFAMNQVNTNPAYLGYRVAPDGTMRYMPWYSACGGFIKKYKK